MTFPKEQGVITLHSAAGADANGPTIYCDGLASVGVQVGGTVTNATIYWGLLRDSCCVAVSLFISR